MPDTDPKDNQTSLVWSAVGVAAGNFLEMYDFMVFGYFAGAIGTAFFPQRDKLSSIFLAFMTFGVGFLIRPFGALLLGTHTDKVGRKQGLILTLGLMSLGTILLACVPDYNQIAWVASLLVVVGRLLQGLSAGAELGSVSVYLAEIARPHSRGFWVSWQSASQQLAVIMAAALGIGISFFLSDVQIAAWGWRLPFIAGLSLVPVLFALRRSMREHPIAAQEAHPPTFFEALQLMGAHFGLIIKGVMIAVMTTVTFYIITVFAPTFSKSVLHLDMLHAFWVTLCVGISNFFWLPFSGAVSDRLGRKPLMFLATTLAVITAYPLMHWLVNAPSFTHLLGVELWLSLLFGTYNGAAVVYLTEIMPRRIRTSGFSLAYSFATCLGGFSPAAVTWLIASTHNSAAPGIWLSAAAAIGFFGTALSVNNPPK